MGILTSIPMACCCACQTLSCAFNMFSCCFQSNKNINFTLAKFLYVTMLGLSTLLAFLLKYTGGDWAHHQGPFSISIGCRNESFQPGYNYSVFGASALAYCAGDGAVYRISLSLALFYVVMAFAANLDDGFLKGYWLFKILIYVGTIVGCFFIPETFFASGIFQEIARFGSMIFLVLQILILIDFAYTWNETWVGNAYKGAPDERPTNKSWLIVIVLTSFAFFGISIAAYAVLFIHIASNPNCTDSQTIVAVTLGLTATGTMLSLFRTQIAGVEGAVLPSSIVALYSVYLSWAALQSNPNLECRVALESSSSTFMGILIAALSLMWSSLRVAGNTQNLLRGWENNQASASVTDITPSSDSNSQLYRVDDNGRTKIVSDLESNKPTKEAPNNATKSKNGKEMVESTGLFFILLVGATLYMSMILTNWGEPSNDINGQTGNASMWAKATSSWVSILLYIWTIIVPCVCKSRSFS